MKIEIPTFEEITLKISYFISLSDNDIRNIFASSRKDIAINDDWWVRGTTPTYVDTYGCSHYATDIDTKIKGVRIAAVYYDADELASEDEVLINNVMFKVVSKGILLSETVIDYTTFKNVDACVYKWTSSIPKPSGREIQVKKITHKASIDIRNPNITLPDYFTFNCTPIQSYKTGYNYWIKMRVSEFTGTYMNIEQGVLLVQDMTCKHYICPILETFLDLPMWFIIKGRIFHSLNKHTALCFNPLGLSCYSTGISATNECTEEEFYLNSEAYQIVEKWKNSIKDN